MRQRAVRSAAWCTRNWPRVKAVIKAVVSFVAGVLILKHEVYEVEKVEPLLLFLGLWLVGIPPAQFFDGLKKLGQEAKGSLEEAAEATPQPPADTPPSDQLKFNDGDA